MENNFQEELVNVKGMHCKNCVIKIENALNELKGIEMAKASLLDEQIFVRFNPDAINLTKINAKIDELGYRSDSNISQEKTDAGSNGSKTEQKKPAEKDEYITIDLSKLMFWKTEKAKDKKEKQSNTIMKGIAYGLVPHIGCIAFIIFTVLGVTAATSFFKPLLMNPYFFYILIAISFVFASISILVYLKQNEMLCWKGVKRKLKYISTMYGTTIGINLLLFMVIFPYAANMSTASAAPLTGAVIGAEGTSTDNLALIILEVNIPCPGHAPLISSELKTIDGVIDIKYSFPNTFEVRYDESQTSVDAMLSLRVFDEYPAAVIGN